VRTQRKDKIEVQASKCNIKFDQQTTALRSEIKETSTFILYVFGTNIVFVFVYMYDVSKTIEKVKIDVKDSMDKLKSELKLDTDTNCKKIQEHGKTAAKNTQGIEDCDKHIKNLVIIIDTINEKNTAEVTEHFKKAEKIITNIESKFSQNVTLEISKLETTFRAEINETTSIIFDGKIGMQENSVKIKNNGIELTKVRAMLNQKTDLVQSERLEGKWLDADFLGRTFEPQIWE